LKPCTFEYVRAKNVSDALLALGDADGEGKILAGGQSLIPLMNLRLARPAVLVDVNGAEELEGAAGADRSVQFGALTRHADLVRRGEHPLMSSAARHIGHAAIRTRGTIGGSIAHADPAAEIPSVVVACDATVRVAGPSGTRDIAGADVFVGMFETTLGPSEIITAVDVPIPVRWGFAEHARRHGDFAQALVAVADLGVGFRIVIGGAAATPIRAEESEHIMASGPVTPARIEQAARASTEGLSPTSDVHTPGDYRLALVQHLVRQTLTEASR
jgi:carbon-monoxide dehydrogenase medium subunit